MACGLRASHTRTSSAERGLPLVSSRRTDGSWSCPSSCVSIDSLSFLKQRSDRASLLVRRCRQPRPSPRRRYEPGSPSDTLWIRIAGPALRYTSPRGAAAEVLVLDMLGRMLHQPLRGHAPPTPGNVEWHQREVFSGPARVPA